MKVLMSFLLVLCGFTGYGQVVAVQNVHQNVVYVGIANSFKIAVENCPADLVVITASGGRIEEDSTGRKGYYYFWPEAQGMANIYIGRKTTKGLKAIDTAVVRCKRIPDEPVVFAGKLKGLLTKRAICTQGSIHTISSTYCSNMPHRFEVIAYTVIIKRNNTELFRRSVSSNKQVTIDSISKRAFLGLKDNDVLIFTDIVIHFANYSVEADPLNFTVVKSDEFDRSPEHPPAEDPVTGEIIEK